MKLRIYGVFVGLVFAGGLILVLVSGIQPHVIEKIRLSVFARTTAVDNSIFISLRPELQAHSLVLWGLEPENEDASKILTEFINYNQDPSTAFQVYIVDKNLDQMIPALKMIPGERIDTKLEVERLATGLKQFENQKLRTLVVMPSAYASAKLVGSPAAQLKNQALNSLNIIFAGFPRLRDAEKNMSIPCNVNVADETGTGPLGCEIVTAARTNYRKHFKAGQMVGLLNQIGQNDYLFLLTREP